MNNITKRYYGKLKEHLGSREYCVGLDLGVGSIGYAIVALEGETDNPSDIILSGSRIFTPSQGAAERRVSRGARNAHHHKRKRLLNLWVLLADKGMADSVSRNLLDGTVRKERPGSTVFNRFSSEILKKDPWTLRYRAIHEELTSEEIGCCIYHLATHRGTSSVRTFLDEDKEKKEEAKETRGKAETTSQAMRNGNYQTYGELIYKERIEPFIGKTKEKPLKNRQNKSFEFVATRDVILKELETILDKQSSFHSELLNDQFIKEIKDLVNFEGEKYVPPAGQCPYVSNEQVLPRAHPLNEERRIWEALNNSKIDIPRFKTDGTIEEYETITFSLEEKELFFKLLRTGKDLTPSVVQKKLKDTLPSHNVTVTLQGRDKKKQKIPGFQFTKLEANQWWKNLTPQKQTEFLRTWNQTPDDKILEGKLQKEFALTEKEAKEAVSTIQLTQGYAPLGETALRYVINHIKNGRSFTEAIEEGRKEGKLEKLQHTVEERLPYYGRVLTDSVRRVVGKSFQEDGRKRIQPHTNSDELKYGRIPNPVVHQTLNELRKVINEMLAIFGRKPKSIMLEVARELKKSKKEREKISLEQNENEKERNRLYNEYCIENGVDQRYIYRFMLMEAQKKQCPYCGEGISAHDVSASRVDIDHILPIEDTEDNSRNNHVLAHNKCNGKKAKRTPYEAFFGEGDRWQSILGMLKTDEMKPKEWRFRSDAMERFEETGKGFKERYKTDNSYIARCAMQYTGCLFEKQTAVVCLKGSLTAKLRLAWKLNGIMIPHARKLIVKPSEVEKFEKYFNKNKKIRIDHRHHALDAIVLAHAGRGYQNLLSRLSAEGYRISYNKRSWISDRFPPPAGKTLDEFSDYIRAAIDKSLVSIKQEHDPNKQLTAETAYQIIVEDDSKFILTTKKNVKDIKDNKKLPFEKAEELLTQPGKFDVYNNKLIRKIIKDNEIVYNKITECREPARRELEDENVVARKKGGKEQKISEKAIQTRALSMQGGKYNTLTITSKEKFFPIVKPRDESMGFGYDKGNNFCLDLYHDKEGKIKGEIIRCVDAVSKKQPLYRKHGLEFIERIYQGDILEIDMSEPESDKKVRSVHAPNAPLNRTFVRVATFTETGNYFRKTDSHEQRNLIQVQFSNILKSEKKKNGSLSISGFSTARLRKVTLSPLGVIIYRSPILKDK